MKCKRLLYAMLIICSTFWGKALGQELSIIPKPNFVEVEKGSYKLSGKTSIVASEEYDDKKASISEVPEFQDKNSQSSSENTEKDFAKDLGEWVRLKITESSEINGVRFPEGIKIDVTKEDSERLIVSGKAELV